MVYYQICIQEKIFEVSYRFTEPKKGSEDCYSMFFRFDKSIRNLKGSSLRFVYFINNYEINSDIEYMLLSLFFLVSHVEKNLVIINLTPKKYQPLGYTKIKIFFDTRQRNTFLISIKIS